MALVFGQSATLYTWSAIVIGCGGQAGEEKRVVLSCAKTGFLSSLCYYAALYAG